MACIYLLPDGIIDVEVIPICIDRMGFDIQISMDNMLEPVD